MVAASFVLRSSVSYFVVLIYALLIENQCIMGITSNAGK